MFNEGAKNHALSGSIGGKLSGFGISLGVDMCETVERK